MVPSDLTTLGREEKLPSTPEPVLETGDETPVRQREV